MKIALIYDCLYPHVKGGGEKRYYEIGHRLKNEHEVHFFSMRFWNGQNNIFKNGIWYHGVCRPKKIYTKSGRRSIFQAIYFSIKLIKPLFRERFDLIDCSAFPYFSVFVVWFYLKIKKVPAVFTWHEYWGLKYWLKYLGILGIFGALVEKLALFFSKNIISVSEFTKKRLIKADKNEKNIIVVPNGIDFEMVQKMNPHPEKSDLIFAGRLIKEKNVDFLINIVAELKKSFPKIKCIIIGDGPEKNSLIILAKTLRLDKNVIFKEFLKEQNKIYSYFKSSKIFVLSSMREGFGIVVLEANACGLPVITINHRNNAAKDLIKEGNNGFISNLNIDSIADRLKNILDDQRLLGKLKIKSKEFSNNYNWSIIIRNLKNYYFKTINENYSNAC